MIVKSSNKVYVENYGVAYPEMANKLLQILSDVIVWQTTTGNIILSSGDLLRVYDAIGSV